ncbi:methyltransferase domain-containing protein [Gordonia jinghuaiqii]|uniref:Class I SAM-dependent methyltransferase n=1 Tax=Gordonia jinghuaiqii TaxID=2758710 RepID=A0A7D7LW10_9ACTN|nr:class I SAM-dependent methyltransferase [Gordonia jinghuaiqii]MCR5977388.1 methyltransferase domain-containing protein [Gordonia jinghuaiqii]QMT00034.1 class I SAM-dependent methyltransferase [Gordonia jinghuaiqii]
MTSFVQPTQKSADEFAERFFASVLATAETMSVYLGDRLGWYRCLVDHGPMTAEDLAGRTATDSRYAREWLEMQGAFGILDCDLSGDAARFGISAGVAEVLTDSASLSYLGPLPRMFAASMRRLPELLDAYRNGGGVSWEELGADARECQAALNRPWFESRLAPALAGVAHLHARLSRPGTRIADIGFGAGYSTIALALAYPEATFVGLDIDEASVRMAQDNAAAAGVADRVRFLIADGDEAGTHGPFDAAFAFECLHDMPRPVEVLAAVRESLAPGAPMIVMDEAVSDEFAGPADDLDKIMYGFSLFVCLPDSMSSPPSAATGTVLRTSTLREYARDAGYQGVEVLPIDDFSFFRFYELAT